MYGKLFNLPFAKTLVLPECERRPGGAQIIRVIREKDRSQTIRLRKKYRERMTPPFEIHGVSNPELEHHNAS
jgi:hypothetical protein